MEVQQKSMTSPDFHAFIVTFDLRILGGAPKSHALGTGLIPGMSPASELPGHCAPWPTSWLSPAITGLPHPACQHSNAPKAGQPLKQQLDI